MDYLRIFVRNFDNEVIKKIERRCNYDANLFLSVIKEKLKK